MFSDLVGKNFSVSFGLKSMPLSDEPLLETIVVLDDSVVNNGHRPARVKVWMGVFIAGRAVRCPTRVANPRFAWKGIAFDNLGQPLVDAAGFLADLNPP